MRAFERQVCVDVVDAELLGLRTGAHERAVLDPEVVDGDFTAALLLARLLPVVGAVRVADKSYRRPLESDVPDLGLLGEERQESDGG